MIIRSHHHCYNPEFLERAAKPHQLGGAAANSSHRFILNYSDNDNSRFSCSAPKLAINSSRSSRRRLISITASLLAACAVLLASPPAGRAEEEEGETLGNVPQTLAGECEAEEGKDCNKKTRIQRPKSRKAETCTVKCVNTCIRGGDGEGPLNIRRPLVVFKQGFRSRHYCLVECSDICNLIGDGDDGP